MAELSNRVIDYIDAALTKQTSTGIGSAFFKALQPLGAKAIYARGYGAVREGPIGENVLARISPPGWEDIYSAFKDDNFLLRQLPYRSMPFKWSDITLISSGEQRLARTLRDCGFPDGLATPCHGPLGYVGVVSIAFERLDQLAPVEIEAIKLSSVVLQNRMRDLVFPEKSAKRTISPREQDCLRYVAEGKSDAQIATLLNISESTVLTHMKNAKRKLNVKTRSQAVAQSLLRGLL